MSMGSDRIRPPWWLKHVNKVMILLNRTGLLKDGPVVLVVTGRRSGQPRSVPVTPFEVDGHRYVVGGLPGADWVRNAQANRRRRFCGVAGASLSASSSCPSSRPGRCCGSSRCWCLPG